MTLLMDVYLKATLILAIAWIATLLLRRASADLRHRVWLAALVAVAILPVFEMVVARALPAFTLTIVSPAVPSASSSLSRGIHATWIGYIWAAGMFLVLAHLGAGLARVVRWTRSARAAGGFRYSDQAGTPLTWGILNPVILLPSYAVGWSEAERQLVIRHELAHIERQDWTWQMFARLLTAVFWFHPLVWLASAELRREAERATDDRVLLSGTSAPDYAEQLVRVARLFSGVQSIAAVAMVRRGRLEGRVREILGFKAFARPNR